MAKVRKKTKQDNLDDKHRAEQSLIAQEETILFWNGIFDSKMKSVIEIPDSVWDIAVSQEPVNNA